MKYETLKCLAQYYSVENNSKEVAEFVAFLEANKNNHTVINTAVGAKLKAEYNSRVTASKPKSTITCSRCSNGVYSEFHILDKVIGTCDTCGDRRNIKKLNGVF